MMKGKPMTSSPERLLTTPVTKRQLLKTGSGLAATIGAYALMGGAVHAASVLGVPWSLPRKPGYLYVRGRATDFDLHLNNELLFGKFDMGGIDITFGDGAPLLGPANGIVKTAREFRNSGKNTKIDYGIVQIVIAHQKALFVEPAQKADVNLRDMVIGRQGNTGARANRSHVHITVYGNAVLCADKERRMSCAHSYLKGDGVSGRFGRIPKQIAPYYTNAGSAADRRRRNGRYPYFWNFVLDPDGLTPDGKPLYESYRDPATDYDTPYLDFVQDRIVGGLQDIASEWERKADPEESQFGSYLKKQVEHRPLYKTINRLWVLYEVALKDRDAGRQGFDLRKRLEVLFDDVREAGSMIKLTSPYIKPGDPDVILSAMDRNPERVELIRDYYGRYLPKQVASRS
jgi:hypothetical protein